MNGEPRQLSDLLEEIIARNKEHSEHHARHLKRIGDFLEKGQSKQTDESIGLLKEILSELRLIRGVKVSPPAKAGVLQRVKNLF